MHQKTLDQGTTTVALRNPVALVQDHHGAYYRITCTSRDGVERFVLLDDTGMRKLLDAGVRTLRVISDGDGRDYVACYVPGGEYVGTAARIIVDLPKDHRVQFGGGRAGRLDLRLRNMHVVRYVGVGVGKAPRLMGQTVPSPMAD